MKHVVLALTLLAAACGPAGAARADCDVPGYVPSQGSVSLWKIFSQSDFFARGGCNPALAARIDAWRSGVLADSLDLWRWREHDTRDSARVLVRAATDWALRELPENLPARARLMRKIAEWDSLLRWSAPDSTGDEAWRVKQLKLFAGDPDEIDLGELVDDCQGDEACRRALSNAAVILTVAVQVRDVLHIPWTQLERATVGHLESLDRRWTAYLQTGRAIYPWELWLASLRTRGAYSGRGFVGPPRSQILLLHPDAGLQSVEQGAERLENVVTLEALGFYRWSWGNDDQMRNPCGASAVLAWDGDREHPLSYGALVHLPHNWSAGVTWKSVDGETETRYMMTGDLGKLFTRRAQLARELVDQVRSSLP